MLESAAHSYGDLFLPFTFHGRAVNTPEMATPISLKRLKDKARRDSMSDAGLDDISRPQAASQTPNGTHERCVAIVPTLEALWPSPNSLRIQFLYHFGPKGLEL